MIKLDVEAYYAASPSAVFASLTDFEVYPVWQPGVIAVRRLTDGPVATGTAVFETCEVFGQQTGFTLTVTSCVPDRLLVLRSDPLARSVISRAWRVEPVTGGSRLTYKIELDGIPRMAEDTVKTELSHQVKQAIDNLAGLLSMW